MLVLVVEDDPDVRATLCEALESEGYRARGARDGIDALNVIAQQRPDLIITDLMMPHMTGLELLGALQEDPDLSSIPTLIITASRPPAAASLTRGTPILRKPLDLERLLGAIRAVTRNPAVDRN